jgi:asparagine synthase (glutamine-hydrolysing)
MMQACSARPVRTFTVAFHERGYNEADHAGRIAGYLRTDHTRLEVTASEARAVIPDLPTIWDEPFADESQIPTFLISRLARSHVTVALSGDGGDECFGGYRRHIVAARAGHVRALPNLARRAAALALLGCGAAVDAFAGFRSTRKPARRGLIAAGDLRKIAHLLSDEASVALYESLIAVADRPEPELRGWLAAPDVPPMPDLAADIMYRDLIGYLPGDVLVKVDRASMAVALEVRAPLLDHRVVEFALRQPTSVKLRHGTGKWVLRKLLARYVPPALFERPKAGFDVPISAWLAGPLSQWAGDVLTGSALRSSGLVDHARIDAIWSSHRSGRSDRGRELWAVLMLGSWLEQSASRPRPVQRSTPTRPFRHWRHRETGRGRIREGAVGPCGELVDGARCSMGAGLRHSAQTAALHRRLRSRRLGARGYRRSANAAALHRQGSGNCRR